jgi:hypothetical protein
MKATAAIVLFAGIILVLSSQSNAEYSASANTGILYRRAILLL